MVDPGRRRRITGHSGASRRPSSSVRSTSEERHLMRHNQRIAIAAGVGLAATLAIPVASAHAISGGKAASSAPWAVQVYNNGRFACTGAMLTDRWVLTAPVQANRPLL